MVTLPRDFKELLQAFLAANVEFLVVGAYAVFVHDRPRATKDLDVWVSPDRHNAQRVYRALAAFGAPLGDLTVEDLTDHDTVYQMGVAPIRIDIITAISGVSFGEAWANRFEDDMDGLRLPFIGIDELILNKEVAARQQDLVDVKRLRRRKAERT